jgi:hypothetical protein
MDGIWGLKGWQWLFICEGLPTVLLGLVVMFYLTDGPAKAHWLAADERDWLIDRLHRERWSAKLTEGTRCGRRWPTLAYWC